ncbi:DUF790 family protein [Deinococcus sp. UYEF24]
MIIPDFRLLHPDSRSVLVKIVGCWRPDYLRKKFERLRKSGRSEVILAVSKLLNLEKAGVNVADFGQWVIFFKGVLDPKVVLKLADALTRGTAPVETSRPVTDKTRKTKPERDRPLPEHQTGHSGAESSSGS